MIIIEKEGLSRIYGMTFGKWTPPNGGPFFSREAKP
jgi:hypothetical protein